jgi:hypothetical protein
MYPVKLSTSSTFRITYIGHIGVEDLPELLIGKKQVLKEDK